MSSPETFGNGNPCFGCAVKVPGGETRKAPCCWGIELVIPTRREGEFVNDEISNTRVVRRTTDHWMGEESHVEIDGPCPKLDTQTGACTIHDDRPMACKDTEALIDVALCAQAPDGRFSHLFFVSLEEVG